MAQEFPHLQVITNGGIQSMTDVEHRLHHSNSNSGSSAAITGAMVGRAVINHPCAFGTVDSLWNHNDGVPKPTREAVLLDYIQYCQREESAFVTKNVVVGGKSPESIQGSLAALRRRLVAVPFQLFAGEEGNEAYQRRIRKLVARAERHSGAGMLEAALSEVPAESYTKPVDEYSTDVCDLPVFQASYQRSGPLQRTIF